MYVFTIANLVKRLIKSNVYVCFAAFFIYGFLFAVLPSCQEQDRALLLPESAARAHFSTASVEVCVYHRQWLQRMLALGSSSVAGSGASAPEKRFINLIAQTLDAQDLLNLGSGGQRASQVLGARAAQALEYQADLVVVMAFTDYAYSDAAAMIEDWRQILKPMAEGGAQIYFGDLQIDPAWICSDQPTANGECYDLSTAEMLNEKNRLAAEVLAPIAGLNIVPVYDVNAAHPEWILPDGHFNDAGHAYLARVFLQAIQSPFLWTDCSGDAGI